MIDALGHHDGDEFAVAALELYPINDVERMAEKALWELAAEFRLVQQPAYLSVSIGIAFYPDHGEDMDSLIKSADQAM